MLLFVLVSPSEPRALLGKGKTRQKCVSANKIRAETAIGSDVEQCCEIADFKFLSPVRLPFRHTGNHDLRFCIFDLRIPKYKRHPAPFLTFAGGFLFGHGQVSQQARLEQTLTKPFPLPASSVCPRSDEPRGFNSPGENEASDFCVDHKQVSGCKPCRFSTLEVLGSTGKSVRVATNRLRKRWTHVISQETSKSCQRR